ncbi:MAG TPA: bifunctional N(6)-L-threonylcarbamoyladenine synthase/serine/threonine protein kinase, partial [Candidatus Thermoplasmatota archaeon]|nr:bifunctional N(6)-L-threonylcarbamoyladenine synthase/serine/threonine protein kinase [Candidatus Thermoplasmatota archaeon]
MRVLGIEGTAHTFAAAVVESDGERVSVLSNVIDMHRPDAGGIHPRVAADHHAEVAGAVVGRALAEAGVAARDLDLVAFSRGPGLGPCLRVAATAARAVALAASRPVLGVNHCVAHLEIGRAVTPAEDPVLLYASGGNTQVIAYHEGRYRVFGETLDIGVGNLLDKFARNLGMAFPGGPKVEELAAKAKGDALVELPYTVMGMDVAFSGLLTAAAARATDNPVEEVCFSLQETAFAMLTEITERALAHAGKEEVVLGGGVACNRRLRRMVDTMCRERGASSWAPENRLCIDNGAMIAHLGAVMWSAGVRQTLAETVVDQRERTDDVAAPWRRGEIKTGSDARPGIHRRPEDRKTSGEQPVPSGGSSGLPVSDECRAAGLLPFRGAEATVTAADFLGRAAVRKVRSAKTYRHPTLDRRVASDRTRREARFLALARRAGVRTP